MKKRYIFYLLLLIGLGYLIYNRITANKEIGGGGAPGGKSGSGAMAISVEGMVVKATSFKNGLEISGAIAANEAVVLRSEVAGLVTSINFKEGSNVSKGSLLVKINDRDIQAQLREAQTRQNLSATSESRAKKLLAKGAISQEEYDTALADLKSLGSQTQLIRAQLAKTSIVAPFSGRVGLRSISVGEYVTPATEIANLISMNPVKIGFSIPEKYVSFVKQGAEIRFNIDGSNKQFRGKVYAIEPTINQQTRTLQIRATAANPNNELLPGSFAQIKLVLSTLPNAILVPSEAIISVLNGKMVYVSRNGKATQIKVETGVRTADSILISKGLAIGDTVLTTGSMSLKPESSVKVKIVK